MEKNIDLSILIPIYNVEKYLEECLQSIYSLNINKEVILVNDGSTDSSLSIAEEFKNKFPDETTLISQKNKGLSGARNTALGIARGKYVYFIDSDDFIDTEKFEIFLKNILNTELDIIHGNALIYKKSSTEEYYNNLKEELPVMNGKDFLYTMYQLKIYKEAVWLNVYRREFLIENNFSFKENLIYEDTLFSFKVFYAAKKIKVISNNFYYYRQREDSITTKKRNYMACFYIWDTLLDFVKNENIAHRRITTYFISLIRSFAKQEKVFNEEIYKKLWNLKKKDLTSYRNLIDLRIRSYFLKKIKYEEIFKII